MAKVYSDALEAASDLHGDRTDPENWYAGVTNDPERRLGEHQVDPENGDYEWIKCKTKDVAADAEAYLHDWGYQGGGGGQQDDTVYVYVYKITADTCEEC